MIINYISTIIIPIIIFIIIGYSFIEKNNVYDDFIKGAIDGGKMAIKIFPTLISVFVAVGCLTNSGILNAIINIVEPIVSKINVPKEVLPLACIRPISGSAATAISTGIMKDYGVDSNIGKIASVIMGSTETTLYTIAIYTGCVGIRKTRGIIIAGLLADITCIIVASYACQFMQ